MELLKPVVRGCAVKGCDRQPVGMTCDNPEHQEIAGEAMFVNAGIPSTDVDDCEVYEWRTKQPGITDNHLPESPIGMDVDVRQCHK